MQLSTEAVRGKVEGQWKRIKEGNEEKGSPFETSY